MATINVVIPDTFVTLYNARRTTWNASAPGALNPMPPANATQARFLLVSYMKSLIRREAMRQGDAQWEADELAMVGV